MKGMKNNSEEKKRVKDFLNPLKFFSNMIFVLGILFSVFAIIYSLYKISNQFEFLISAIYYSYLVFGVVSASLFGLGLWKLHDELKVNISILLATTGIIIYGFEIYLDSSPTLFKKSESRKAIAEQMGIEYDARSKLEVIEDLIDENVQAYPIHSASKEFSVSNGLKTNKGRIFPLGGISNVATIGNNESGYFPNMKIDEYGFHNPNGLYKKDEVDAVLIGDSYTEGYSVHSNETISSVLRELNFASISVGKSGSGPLIELATLKEYAEPLKPKIVLWMFYVNDLLDLERELKSSILTKYLIEEDFSQSLIFRQNEIDSVLIDYIQCEMRKIKKNKQESLGNKIIKLLKLTNLRDRISRLLTLKPISASTYIVFNDILKKSKQMVSEWGGELYFVYLPSFYMYSDSNTLQFDNEQKNREIVLETMNELLIPVIDIHKEVFETHQDPVSLFPFRIKGHYNAEGYRLIAEKIGKRFKIDGF